MFCDTVLIFLQSLLDKGRAFSKLKVYLAAISACHVGINVNSGTASLGLSFPAGSASIAPCVKTWMGFATGVGSFIRASFRTIVRSGRENAFT